ncbi:hypothetical protein L484_015518 [Morus notabilis]|uniref:Uncharacterized protein n=1 Tax=Morus notabilis TaxID=981085 RepID=W9RJE3_9ROSA|nr:hypothetical protein L484_015518 [Morus notabilis]
MQMFNDVVNLIAFHEIKAENPRKQQVANRRREYEREEPELERGPPRRAVMSLIKDTKAAMEIRAFKEFSDARWRKCVCVLVRARFRRGAGEAHWYGGDFEISCAGS